MGFRTGAYAIASTVIYRLTKKTIEYTLLQHTNMHWT